jgi:site-specific DNA recombinase
VLARPALDRLRDNAMQKLFEAVLIHAPDRLARTYVHQEVLIEELKKAGVQIIFLNRPLADTPEDRMLQGMQGLFAEYEKAKIAERFRRGKLHKARSGRIVGHMAPYGYHYMKNPGAREGGYVIDSREAEVVRLLFQSVANAQLTLGSLVRLLHQKGILPRKAGERWQRSSLHRILRNETYVGTTYYNKGYSVESEARSSSPKYRRVQRTSRRARPKQEWVPIPVPSIIDRGLFDRVQQQLVRNSQLSPRKTKFQYLLRGLTRCGQCGCLYAGIPCHGKRQYRCRNKERRFPLPKNCPARMISAGILEPVVWSAVEEAINKPSLILTQFESLQSSMRKEVQVTDAERQRLEAAVTALGSEENRLLEAYRSAVITLDQLRTHTNQLNDKRKALLKERRAVLAPPATLQQAKASLRHYAEFIKTRMADLSFDERQTFLRSLVSEIEIFDDTIRIKGSIPMQEPPKHNGFLRQRHSSGVDAGQRSNFSLRPHLPEGVDAQEQVEVVIIKELKHGKARPKRRTVRSAAARRAA